MNNASNTLSLLAASICYLAAPLFSPALLGAEESKVGLKQIAEGFTSPTCAESLPDGSKRMLIADQVGTIHLLGDDGKLSENLFLDLRERMVKLNQGFDERGLLGIAFHPDFKSNRRLFVYYSAPLRAGVDTNWNHTSHLSEFKVKPDLSSADPASEKVILQIDEPQFNHNGGRLAFGPDGFLYIAMGDGGGGNDGANVKETLGHSPQGNAQDTSKLLGKILRIDVNKGASYGIPTDNPFADGKQGRPEIFAFGLRNPWGISFDRGGSRELFVADVGQNLFEEVNIIQKGGNYGWRLREGFHAFDPAKVNEVLPEGPRADANGRPLIDPVLVYPHPPRNKIDPTQVQGISITGGYVYRGKVLPELTGKYVFADWSRSWALPDGILLTGTRGGEGNKWKVELLPLASHPKLGAYVVGMGEDTDGELYVLTNGRNALSGKTGKVFKLVKM